MERSGIRGPVPPRTSEPQRGGTNCNLWTFEVRLKENVAPPGNSNRLSQWPIHLKKALSAAWFPLILCLILPFIRGKVRLEDEFSGAVALTSLALSLYGSVLWLVAFVICAAKLRGRVSWRLWLQATFLAGLELFAGSVIAHP